MDEQRHLRANYDIKQRLLSNRSNTNELWWKEAHAKSTVHGQPIGLRQPELAL